MNLKTKQALGKLRLEQEQELEKRIKERVEKIKTRKAHNHFLSNLSYPEIEKEMSKARVIEKIKQSEVVLPQIKTLVKMLKSKYIPQIWDQNAIIAVYLLITKAFGNLETILLLSEHGRNQEIIELARSGQESLDLAFLFLEPGQEKRLEDWFKGKIIPNRVSREALHSVVNSEKYGTTNLPFYNLKTQVYATYSLYTHSSYVALLDSVDVFHEDFDYNQISGFHYTLKNFDIAFKNLAVSLLLELKNVFTINKDLERADEAERLLGEMGNYKASPEELKEIVEEYKS